jgi:hypothetical protein
MHTKKKPNECRREPKGIGPKRLAAPISEKTSYLDGRDGTQCAKQAIRIAPFKHNDTFTAVS